MTFTEFSVNVTCLFTVIPLGGGGSVIGGGFPQLSARPSALVIDRILTYKDEARGVINWLATNSASVFGGPGVELTGSPFPLSKEEILQVVTSLLLETAVLTGVTRTIGPHRIVSKMRGVFVPIPGFSAHDPPTG